MPNRSKFNVSTSKEGKKKRTFDGITFDSELELRAYKDYLLPLKNSGVVKNIVLQPKYLLQSKYEKYGKKILPIYYVADFEIEFEDGKIEIWDIKGMVLSDCKIKRKLFDYIYPDKTLRFIGFSKIDGGFVDIETIEKGRRLRKKYKQNA